MSYQEQLASFCAAFTSWRPWKIMLLALLVPVMHQLVWALLELNWTTKNWSNKLHVTFQCLTYACVYVYIWKDKQKNRVQYTWIHAYGFIYQSTSYHCPNFLTRASVPAIVPRSEETLERRNQELLCCGSPWEAAKQPRSDMPKHFSPFRHHCAHVQSRQSTRIMNMRIYMYMYTYNLRMAHCTMSNYLRNIQKLRRLDCCKWLRLCLVSQLSRRKILNK